MDAITFERIYETITGQVLPEYAVSGAQNIFAEGQAGDQLYAKVYEASCRLCSCLEQEDAKDLDLILHCMDTICKLVSEEVYRFLTQSMDCGK